MFYYLQKQRYSEWWERKGRTQKSKRMVWWWMWTQGAQTIFRIHLKIVKKQNKTTFLFKVLTWMLHFLFRLSLICTFKDHSLLPNSVAEIPYLSPWNLIFFSLHVIAANVQHLCPTVYHTTQYTVQCHVGLTAWMNVWTNKNEWGSCYFFSHIDLDKIISVQMVYYFCSLLCQTNTYVLGIQ